MWVPAAAITVTERQMPHPSPPCRSSSTSRNPRSALSVPRAERRAVLRETRPRASTDTTARETQMSEPAAAPAGPTRLHVESWCPLQPPLPEYRWNAVGWRLGRELLPPHRASPSSRHRRRRMRPLDNISKALMDAPSDLKAGSGGSATVTDRYTRHVRTHSERPPSAPRAVPISRSNPTNAILRQRRRECVQRRLARREDDPSRLASERTEAARTLPSEYVVVDPHHLERDLIAVRGSTAPRVAAGRGLSTAHVANAACREVRILRRWVD